MFPQLVLLLVTASFPSRAAVSPKKAPGFECVDGEGTVFKVWIGTDQNRMIVKEKDKEREILLSGANFGLTFLNPELGLRYNRWNAAGSDLFTLLDVGQEFSVAYLVTNGSSRARVSIVVDHRERLGLTCKVSGVSTSVVSVDAEVPAAKRYTAAMAEVVGMRTRKGTLEPIAVLRIEGTIRRAALSAEMKKPAVYKAFVDEVGPPLKSIDPRSARQIGARLKKGPPWEFWKKLLEDTQFKYHPEASRLASWVKDGARPDPDRHIPSVIAGFNNFVSSPGFKDDGVKSFFISEVAGSLKEIDDDAALKLNAYFSREARAFFETLWSRANNRKTLRDFPDLAANVAALSTLINAKDFDALKTHDQILLSVKLVKRYGPEAKGLYLTALAPAFKGMTARRREDFKGWLEEPEEKDLISELLNHTPQKSP